MPDATLGDYAELTTAVVYGPHPILPKPHWGQDAAVVAFYFDALREQTRVLAEFFWWIKKNPHALQLFREETEAYMDRVIEMARLVEPEEEGE